MIKAAAHSLLAFTCLVSLSASRAGANPIHHVLVYPGTCLNPGPGTATATFSNGALTLTAGNEFPFGTTAAAIAQMSSPGGGTTGFPIPQGTFSFTCVNNTPGPENAYQIVGYYAGGPVLLQFGSVPSGTTNFSVSTVQANMGQLQAVSFLYTAAGGQGPQVQGNNVKPQTPEPPQSFGSVTVSNFRVIGISVRGFGVGNPQTCSPFMTPVNVKQPPP